MPASRPGLPEAPDRLAAADRGGGGRQQCCVCRVERGERLGVGSAERGDECRAHLGERLCERSRVEVAGHRAQRHGACVAVSLQLRRSAGDGELGAVERFLVAQGEPFGPGDREGGVAEIDACGCLLALPEGRRQRSVRSRRGCGARSPRRAAASPPAAARVRARRRRSRRRTATRTAGSASAERQAAPSRNWTAASS